VLAVLLATTGASAGVMPAGTDGSDTPAYKAEDSGPVQAYTIFTIYNDATSFCAQQKKEVSTIDLELDTEPQTIQHKWLSAKLIFACAQPSVTCWSKLPLIDTRVDAESGHRKRCSDAEFRREIPPP
jgi:hypothetical protein